MRNGHYVIGVASAYKAFLARKKLELQIQPLNKRKSDSRHVMVSQELLHENFNKGLYLLKISR